MDIKDALHALEHKPRAHTEINLSNHNLSVADLESFKKAMEGNTHVKKLTFVHCGLGPGAAKILSYLLITKHITELTLTDNLIGDVGAKYIAEVLKKNRFLKDLNLLKNEIGDEGGEVLIKALIDNAHLEHLNISSNALGEKTAQALSDLIMKNKTLKSVNINTASIPADSGPLFIDALAVNTSLEELVIHDTQISKEHQDEIKALLEPKARAERKKIQTRLARPKIPYKRVAELNEIFNAKNWVSKPNAMKEAWRALPKKERDNFNISGNLAQVRRLSLVGSKGIRVTLHKETIVSKKGN